jgi:protein-tyrosine phosphatase
MPPTAVIVMLTALRENSREKCYPYYPDNLDSPPRNLTFTTSSGDTCSVTLSLLEKTYDEAAKTVVRKLSLQHEDDPPKIVWHLYFEGWPDQAVPEDANRAALLSLISLSRSKNDGSFAEPRTIHCSAGVGRSGTFIALEHLLAELDSGAFDCHISGDETAKPPSLSPSDDDPIYETVEKLREQRMFMVQTLLQFSFLYDMMREQFLKRAATVIANRKAAEANESMERISLSGGEPSPKVRRISRLRSIFRGDKSRDGSKGTTAEEKPATETAEDGKSM